MGKRQFFISRCKIMHVKCGDMEKPMINYHIDRNRVDISRWYGNGLPMLVALARERE